MSKKSPMNEEIKNHPIYKIEQSELVRYYGIESTKDYNHALMELHHYVKQQSYDKDPNWFISRKIKQKLILMTKIMHDHLEDPVYSLSEKDFLKIYGIDKKELLFNKKWSNYENPTT